MNIYDKIDARIKELGIKKAHVSTSLGMSREARARENVWFRP